MTMTGEELALETRGLNKSFGALEVARDVNLRLEKGARHALIGPNGAGKTTLVNLITGVLRPSSGQVFVNGEDVTRLASDRRVKRGLVRTFQINQLFQTFTVIDNIVMAIGERDGLAVNPLKRMRKTTAAYDEALELLSTFGMERYAYRVVNALPYGQKRLVEICIALSLKPGVLLLDEPAAGVPSSEVHIITDAIASLEAQMAVLIIEHNMDVVFRFTNAITVLDSGAVLAHGTPDEIAENQVVKQRYLGQTLHG